MNWSKASPIARWGARLAARSMKSRGDFQGEQSGFQSASFAPSKRSGIKHGRSPGRWGAATHDPCNRNKWRTIGARTLLQDNISLDSLPRRRTTIYSPDARLWGWVLT